MVNVTFAICQWANESNCSSITTKFGRSLWWNTYVCIYVCRWTCVCLGMPIDTTNTNHKYMPHGLALPGMRTTNRRQVSVEGLLPNDDFLHAAELNRRHIMSIHSAWLPFNLYRTNEQRYRCSMLAARTTSKWWWSGLIWSCSRAQTDRFAPSSQKPQFLKKNHFY